MSSECVWGLMCSKYTTGCWNRTQRGAALGREAATTADGSRRAGAICPNTEHCKSNHYNRVTEAASIPGRIHNFHGLKKKNPTEVMLPTKKLNFLFKKKRGGRTHTLFGKKFPKVFPPCRWCVTGVKALTNRGSKWSGQLPPTGTSRRFYNLCRK